MVHAPPEWAPDGARLVYRRVDTQSDIAIVDVGSQAAIRLTADAVLDTDPTWAPDGRSVDFTSARGGGMNLWRLPLAASGMPAGPPQQLTTGAGDDIQPAGRTGRPGGVRGPGHQFRPLAAAGIGDDGRAHR
ncbi:MAG: hypothetical protein ACREOC_06750 [Gemmatimonadales bacterium]